jgi:hypothetical protein
MVDLVLRRSCGDGDMERRAGGDREGGGGAGSVTTRGEPSVARERLRAGAGNNEGYPL